VEAKFNRSGYLQWGGGFPNHTSDKKIMQVLGSYQLQNHHCYFPRIWTSPTHFTVSMRSFKVWPWLDQLHRLCQSCKSA